MENQVVHQKRKLKDGDYEDDKYRKRVSAVGFF